MSDSLLFAKAQQILWKHPEPFKRYYELWVDHTRHVTLHFEKAFGSLAAGAVDGHSFSLKRSGFVHAVASIRDAAGQDLGRFEPRMSGGGRLRFLHVDYDFRSRGLLGGRWTLLDAAGRELFVLQPRGLSGREASVDITDHGLAHPHLATLLLFSWYALLLLQDDANAAAAASVPAI